MAIRFCMATFRVVSNFTGHPWPLLWQSMASDGVGLNSFIMMERVRAMNKE